MDWNSNGFFVTFKPWEFSKRSFSIIFAKIITMTFYHYLFPQVPKTRNKKSCSWGGRKHQDKFCYRRWNIQNIRIPCKFAACTNQSKYPLSQVMRILNLSVAQIMRILNLSFAQIGLWRPARRSLWLRDEHPIHRPHYGGLYSDKQKMVTKIVLQIFHLLNLTVNDDDDGFENPDRDSDDDFRDGHWGL